MDTVVAVGADGAVIRLIGDVDDEVSLIGVVERALTVPTGQLVLDLRGVTSINEHGVGGLLAARRLCARADVELLIAQSHAVSTRLERYGLASVFVMTTLN